jgi:hypothetical protein
MIRRQPLHSLRQAMRPALILAGLVAYLTFAVLVMLVVFRIAGT